MQMSGSSRWYETDWIAVIQVAIHRILRVG